MIDEPTGESAATRPAAIERLRARLTAPRGARRIDELLACDDAAAAVAELPATELYEIVHDAGFEDAGELIALATPEQLQGCLDLDSWDKDAFAPASARPWIAAIIETGYEKLGQVWAALDAEARALFLQQHAVVYDVTLGEHPDEDPRRSDEPEEGSLVGTPDGFFVLRVSGDDDVQRLTMRLVEDLYRADAALARHTLQSARSEPASTLEETSYRWRSGRMADQGYVDFHEALELFTPLDLDRIQLGPSAQSAAALEPTGVSLSAPIAKEVLARSFLSRALALVPDALADKVEAAILYLVNRVLAAARARPGQHEVVERAALYASATLSLGVEAVARGEPARGAEALCQIALPQLFRVGYTLGLRLAKLAVVLAARARGAEPPAAEVVAALCSPRPLWARSGDEPPAAGVRPLESLADIRRATSVLRGLTARIALAERLGVPLAVAGEQAPSLEAWLRGALLRVAGGGALTATALTVAELSALRDRAFVEGRLPPVVRERCHEAVGAALAEHVGGASAIRPMEVADLPPVVDALLDQLEATLGPISDRLIEARFLGGLVALASDAPSAAL